MSMPYIISHNETIYSLEEKESEKFKKPPRYHSIYKKQIKNEYNQLTASAKHRTMGYAEYPLASPKHFLKIGGGIHPERCTKDHQCVKGNMPPIPKRNNEQQSGNKKQYEQKTMQHRANNSENQIKENKKNFKLINIQSIKSAEPKRGTAASASSAAVPRFVDTRTGDFHNLHKSGLMPVFIYQPKFGKLPKYLIKRIHDVAVQEQLFRDEEARKQPLCRYVTQEERIELIAGLKHNWEKLQQTYQGLPVLTDTIPKALRKTKLENDLKQLEKDILLVENHPYIYVYNDKQQQ